ncbi:MAG TPA: hypothetical protein VGF55_16735 [Gemmataceae bacterium]|jgi:hypothetical protein
MNEPPVVQYMILCKDVRLEGPRPKRLNLYGLMIGLTSASNAFPAPFPDFCVFLALRNGRGPGTGDVSAIYEDTGEVCWNSGPHSLNFSSDPLEFRTLAIRVTNAVFPAAGAYMFEFRYNGTVLATQSLIVTGGNL